MITKKDWDSLSLDTKREVLEALYGSSFESYATLKKLLYEYRHNFDFDDTGRKLKKVLSYIYRVSESELYVRVPIQDRRSAKKFLPNPAEPKKITKATSPKPSYTGPYRWYCDYISKTDDDVCHVWCEADSEQDARYEFESEYWDIKEIIRIYRK